MQFSVATKLNTILGIILLIVFSVIFTQTSQRIHNATITTTEERLSSESEQLSAFIDNKLTSLYNQIGLLSANTLFRDVFLSKDFSSPLLQQTLNTIYKQSSAFTGGAFLVDTNGTVVASVHAKHVGKNLSKLQYIQAHLKDNVDRHIEQEPRKSLATGAPIIVISASIRDENGKLLGILGSGLNLRRFVEKQITNRKYFKTGFPILFEKSGLVVAHPNKDLIMTDGSSLPAFTFATQNGNIQATGSLTGATGRKLYASFSPLPNGLFIAGILVPKAEVHEVESNLQTSLLILFGLSLFATMLCIYCAFRYLVAQKLQAASRYADAIAHGDFSSNLPAMANDEVGEICQKQQ